MVLHINILSTFKTFLIIIFVFVLVAIGLALLPCAAYASNIDEPPPSDEPPPFEPKPVPEEFDRPDKPPIDDVMDKIPKLLIKYENGETFVSILDPIELDPLYPEKRKDNPTSAKFFRIEEVIRDSNSLTIVRNGVKARFQVKEEVNATRNEILRAIEELRQIKNEMEAMDVKPEMDSEAFYAIEQRVRPLKNILEQHQFLRIDIPLKDFVESLGGQYEYDAQNNISWIIWP